MLKKYAKQLRREQTEAERSLWYRIRNRHLLGCKFRRQYIFGKYIVDFVCLEKSLIIELDGSQHFKQINYDNARTQYLNSLGFKVLRFWNNDVMRDPQSVLEKIYQTIIESPSP